MDLRGRLSNPELQNLLQCLTNHKPAKPPAYQPKPAAGTKDGRREFGTVSAAVISVLREAGSEMRLKAIHAEVESLLGGRVSFYSVADYLHRRSRGRKPLFERTRHAHYRLLGSGTPKLVRVDGSSDH